MHIHIRRVNINDNCTKLSPKFDDVYFPREKVRVPLSVNLVWTSRALLLLLCMQICMYAQVHFWNMDFGLLPSEQLYGGARLSAFDWWVAGSSSCLLDAPPSLHWPICPHFSAVHSHAGPRFGNECRTFTIATSKHRGTDSYESLRGKSPEAQAANADLQKTVQIIRTKVGLHHHRCFQPGEYTFAIENPKSSNLWNMKEIQELVRDPEVKATFIELTQCRFGGRVETVGENELGPPIKATTLLTNNPALVDFFGTAHKDWFSDAPDPRYVCGEGVVCQYHGCSTEA